MMRIAIVNDTASAITDLKRVLRTVPHYQVIWTANDGEQAVTKCQQSLPDLILLDLLMPVMDGVEATRQIMKTSPCAIVIVTSSPEKQVAKVYEAMGYGALDAVDLPVFAQENSAAQISKLLAKIVTVGKLLQVPSTPLPTSWKHPRYHPSPVPLVAIGSSTGGPKALAEILSQLPTHFSAALVIVQHVDGSFSSGFIEWLNQQTPLPVSSAITGDRPQKGKIFVASSNDHLYLRPDLSLDYTPNPLNYPYRPSVDVFFKSLAQHWGSKGTAILLTGMGRDGAQGLWTLRQQGWHTIAQDRVSCIVYGMPKAAVELNAAVEVLSPQAIAVTLREKLT